MKPTKNELNAAQERIMNIMSNILDFAVETKEMVDLMGDEPVKTKRGTFTLNKMFNFKKMNFDGLMVYLTLSNQSDKVFGTMTKDGIEVANMIIKEQFDDYMTKEIRKIFNK